MTNQRSLILTDQQWANIDRLAITTDSRSTGGPRKTVGLHSWRAMLRRVGVGELWVIDPATLPEHIQEMVTELAAQGGAE